MLGLLKQSTQSWVLNTAQTYCLTVLEPGRLRSRCQQGCALSQIFGWILVCLFLVSAGLLAIFGAHGLVDTLLYPASSRGSSLCVCGLGVLISPFIRHQSYLIRAHSNDLILTWLHLQKLCLLTRSYSEVEGINFSSYLF